MEIIYVNTHEELEEKLRIGFPQWFFKILSKLKIRIFERETFWSNNPLDNYELTRSTLFIFGKPYIEVRIEGKIRY